MYKMDTVIEQSINKTWGMTFMIGAQKLDHIHFSKYNTDALYAVQDGFLVELNIKTNSFTYVSDSPSIHSIVYNKYCELYIVKHSEHFSIMKENFVGNLELIENVQFDKKVSDVNILNYNDTNKLVTYIYDDTLFVYDIIYKLEHKIGIFHNNYVKYGSVEMVLGDELGIRKTGYWIDPSAKHILMVRNDSSNIISKYRSLYPSKENIKSSLVLVKINDDMMFEYIDVDIKKDFETYQYIINCGWFDTDNFWVMAVNSKFTELKIFKYGTSLCSELLYSESYPNIQTSTFISTDHDNNLFYCSSKSGYMHIYMNDKQITCGEWNVHSEEIWHDDKNKLIYFIGYKDSVTETQLYVTDYEGCLVRITQNAYSHDICIDPTCTKIVDQYSSVSCYYGCRLHINNEKHWITTDNILPEIHGDESNKTEFFDVIVEKESLKGKIIFPSNIESIDRIPLIVVTYGGPGIQIVNNKYNTGYSLISNVFCDFGFAVASLDNRGTANRGTEFESVLKHGFGTTEASDNMNMIEFLMEKYQFLDKDNIFVYGHSYGGFLSITMLARYSHIVNSVISVSAVYDWMDYVKYYRDRFLQDNDAIIRSSLENIIDSNYVPMGDDRMLVMHGVKDKNVLFINFEKLIKKLDDKNISYKKIVYPEDGHTFSFLSLKKKLFDTIEFILQKYKKI
jgi:dipeptidyl-peptidase-4